MSIRVSTHMSNEWRYMHVHTRVYAHVLTNFEQPPRSNFQLRAMSPTVLQSPFGSKPIDARYLDNSVPSPQPKAAWPPPTAGVGRWISPRQREWAIAIFVL